MAAPCEKDKRVARLSKRRLYGDADDRLPQPAQSGKAPARTGADVGDVSMQSQANPLTAAQGKHRTPRISPAQCRTGALKNESLDHE